MDFLKRRPEILKIDLYTLFVGADRFVRQVDVHASGQCKRNDQRRRHKKVCFDVLMNSSLEISIAGKDRRGNQIVLDNGLLDVRMKRPGVPYARCATVSDDIEPELIQVRLQPGFGEIVSYYSRTRSHRRLYSRIDLQPSFYGFLRE